MEKEEEEKKDREWDASASTEDRKRDRKRDRGSATGPASGGLVGEPGDSPPPSVLPTACHLLRKEGERAGQIIPKRTLLPPHYRLLALTSAMTLPRCLGCRASLSRTCASAAVGPPPQLPPLPLPPVSAWTYADVAV
jgi:hypothetical protein